VRALSPSNGRNTRLDRDWREASHAPNQDFVLGSVPRVQAGTAGGAPITAQRPGAAIGVAVIGTVLFGTGQGTGGAGGSAGSVVPSLVHSAQTATAVNLCFIVAALLCALGLPRRLADQDDADPNVDAGNGQPQAEPEDARAQVEPSDRPAGDGAVR
jgi:hypothetical protein